MSVTRLSPREQQIAALMAEGHSGVEIAQRLALSPKTVATHKDRIKNKMGIGTNTAWFQFLKNFVPQ